MLTEEQSALVAGALYFVFVLEMAALVHDAARLVRSDHTEVAVAIRPAIITAAACLVGMTFLRFSILQFAAGGVEMGRVGVIAADPDWRVFNAVLLVLGGLALRGWRER